MHINETEQDKSFYRWRSISSPNIYWIFAALTTPKKGVLPKFDTISLQRRSQNQGLLCFQISIIRNIIEYESNHSKRITNIKKARNETRYFFILIMVYYNTIQKSTYPIIVIPKLTNADWKANFTNSLNPISSPLFIYMRVCYSMYLIKQ